MFTHNAVMEVAVGDYDVDLSRMVNAATKKYYEDRDHHCLMIEQQVEKLNGECSFLSSKALYLIALLYIYSNI